jgi:chromosome segregation ATPase
MTHGVLTKIVEELNTFEKTYEQFQKNILALVKQAEREKASLHNSLVQDNQELKTKICNLNSQISELEDRVSSSDDQNNKLLRGFNEMQTDLRKSNEKFAELEAELKDKTDLFERLGVVMKTEILPAKRKATSSSTEPEPKRKREGFPGTDSGQHQDSAHHPIDSRSHNGFVDQDPENL